ncbi:MAG: hypothetical protein IJM08_07325 [Firmicutes bacterium]|nr:hypothetical protein [Bacillota bacterium]
MKYVNQLDYPYIKYETGTMLKDAPWGKTSTFATSGCGLASAIMVVDKLTTGNDDFGIPEALQLSYDNQANFEGGTNYLVYSQALANKFGLKLKLSRSMDEVIDCLKNGGCVVANVGGDRVEEDGSKYTGVFSHGGHYIFVESLCEDGRLSILDPSLKEGKFEEEGRQGKVEVKGKFCYCQPEILIKDSDNRTPSYYLFRR